MSDDERQSEKGLERDAVIDTGMKKRRIIILLIAYSAILGVIDCFRMEGDKGLDLVLSLPALILAITWCYWDASERGHRIGRMTKLTLILMFMVGFPIYLFQTRGWGAFKALGMTLLLFVAMFICEQAAIYLTMFVGDIAGWWEWVD